MLKQTGFILISASLLATGCGDSSSDGGDTPPVNTTATLSGVAITTANTSMVIGQATSLSSTLSDQRSTTSSYKLTTSATPQSELYAPLATAMALRPSRIASAPSKVTDLSSVCSVGGSAEVVSPDFPDANPYEVTMTFIDCDDGNTTTNGVISLSETTTATGYDFSISMGGTTTYTMAANDGSMTLTSAVTMSGSDNLDGTAGSANMNGSMGMSFGADSLSVDFNALSVSWSDSGTTSTSSLSGGMSVSATSSGVTQGFSATFTSFTFIEDYMTSETTVNGTIAFSSSPASCADGTYTFTTIAPIVDYGSGPVAGTLQVNNATISYNSDSTVVITLDDGTSRTYTQAGLQAEVCSG